jgi:hypothetical protein
MTFVPIFCNFPEKKFVFFSFFGSHNAKNLLQKSLGKKTKKIETTPPSPPHART